jgi:site-specific recombinase XerD
LPDVRSDADCRRLIATLQKPVYRGCFTLIYAYGLRITEAVTLPVTAVDSKQMTIRVIGKRNNERILPLSMAMNHSWLALAVPACSASLRCVCEGERQKVPSP